MNLVAALRDQQKRQRSKLLCKKAARVRQREGMERGDQGHKQWNQQHYEKTPYPTWEDNDE